MSRQEASGDASTCSAGACVMLLMGLPGSGKTTLCRKLFESRTNTCSDHAKQFSVIHICYDDMMPDKLLQPAMSPASTLPNDIPLEQATSELEWKKTRRDVLQAVRAFLINHTKHEYEEPDESDKNDMLVKFHELARQRNVKVGCGNLVLLIDDNMFYRSMRYEYYQLARQLEVSFASVYVQCSVDDALRNNKQRSLSLPDSIITGMAARIEIPAESWENWVSWKLGEDISGVLEFISQALCQPLHDHVAEADRVKQLSQQESINSLLQQADTRLRAMVSEVMKCAKQTGVSKIEMRNYAARANASRTRVMDALRQAASSDISLLLSVGLQEEFDKHMTE